MPLALPYLALTDGTTTATLTDGTNYALAEQAWAPQIADWRRSGMGGRGPYEDQTETIMVNVIGASATATLANLARLKTLLEQAARWALGESVNPVTIQIQTQGSFLGIGSAVVLGGSVRAPSSFTEQMTLYDLRDVELTIRRRGQWLMSSYTEENLLSGSGGDFSSTGGWSLSLAGGNVGVLSINGGAGLGTNGGGVFSVNMSTSLSTQNNRQIRSPQFSIVNGATYTFSLELSGVASTVSVLLQSLGSGTSSNTVVLATSNVAFPTTRVNAVLVATRTASDVVIRIDIASTSTGIVVQFAEPLLDAGITTDWHRTSTEMTVATSSAAVNTSLLTASFPTSQPLGPCSVRLSGFQSTQTPSLGTSYLIVSDAANNIRILEPPNGVTPPSGWSNVVESGQFALNNSLYRYTPSGTTEVSGGSITLPATLTGELAVFATVRNNSSTTNFLVTFKATGNGASSETQAIVVPPYSGSAAPSAVCLGTIAHDYGAKTYELLVQASAASGSLDFDRVIVVLLSTATRVIKVDPLTLNGILTAGVSTNLEYQDRSLTHRAPFVGAINASSSTDVAFGTYYGDGTLLQSGTTTVAYWLAVQGANWAQVNNGVGGDNLRTSLTLRVARYMPSLTPL